MLKIGKIPENILKRSVLKRISSKKKYLLSGPKVGNDASVIDVCKEESIAISTKPMTIINDCDIDRAVIGAINNISASGGKCISIQVTLLLPESSTEDDIKHYMSYINDLCKEKGIVVSGGHTEVMAAVSEAVIDINAIGKITEKVDVSKKAKPGDDIVVTKWIALEGTSIIARAKADELKKRFSIGFIDRAIDYIKYLDISKEADIAKQFGVSVMHDASTGGIMGALWELGEALGCGISVDMMAIPVKQESIEICEEYGLNPYELLSGGCLVIATPRGKQLVEELWDNEIEATIIGKVTDNNDKVVILNDEKRFIEPRRNEELYKL